MKNKAAKISAGALAVSMLGAATFPLIAQASDQGTGEPTVSNYESVSAQLSAAGEKESAVIVDQLTILGNGEVTVANPVAADDQRNLSGFGSAAGEGGVATQTVNVNGSTELRSLADYEGDLPVSLKATYYLDGREVSPDELKKASGELRVEYTVTNETGATETITYQDASGATVTKDVTIYTPIAGSFTTVLPSSFSNVSSPEAAVAADGRGGTKMQWSLTLLPPLSGTSATFGYTADIVNGSIPQANLSVIPVKPMSNPTAKSAVASYESGSKSGADLYAGGVKLDDGLQQLADGAGQLLAGLAALHTGAGSLSDGLATANAGAHSLNDGATKVDDGAQQLADGSGKLSAGLGQLEDGINTLEEAKAFDRILDGLDKISRGVGDQDDPKFVNGVPADLNTALTYIRAGLGQMQSETATSQEELQPLLTAGTKAAQGAASLSEAISKGARITMNGQDVTAQVGGLAQYTGLAAGALEQVDEGMSKSIDAYGQLGDGLEGVQANVNNIGSGAKELYKGVDTIYTILTQDMANGVRDLSDGADQLNVGMQTLAAGTTQLADGSGSLAAGTDKLAAGAAQLADGLAQANSKAPALTAGIDQLSTEGAGAIIESGMATQLKYEEYVAQIAAAAQRTDDGALPAGAPTQAKVATAAYSMDVAGTGDEGADLGLLALVAAGLFAAAGTGLAVRERKNRA